MSFGIPKCGLMIVGGSEEERAEALGKVMLQGEAVPVVRDYTYLGCKVKDDLSLADMLGYRLEKARKCLFAMQHFITNRRIPVSVKVLVLRASVY